VQAETSSRTADTSRPTVGVGRTVEIEWADRGRSIYLIGAEGSSDLANDVIAADAPLAHAVIGATAGDVRTYRVGGSSWTVTVINIGRRARVV